MIRRIRLALAWRRLNAANARYLAYCAVPPGQWNGAAARALLEQLLHAERVVSALANPRRRATY